MRFLKIVVFSFFAFACHRSEHVKIDPGTPRYETTDASELFFKNVRSPYYDLEENEAAGMRIYRFNERMQDLSKPILHVLLAHRWKQDEVFVMVEPAGLWTDSDKIIVNYKNNENGDHGQLEYLPGNVDAQYRFAALLYLQITAGSTFKAVIDGVEIPFLEDKKTRDAVRIPLVDFYRLVEIF